MAQQIADRRDMDFVMWEQLDGEELLKFDEYKEFNKKTCDMILTEARKLMSAAAGMVGANAGQRGRERSDCANATPCCGRETRCDKPPCES